jgi:hypothetical protein
VFSASTLSDTSTDTARFCACPDLEPAFKRASLWAVATPPPVAASNRDYGFPRTAARGSHGAHPDVVSFRAVVTKWLTCGRAFGHILRACRHKGLACAAEATDGRKNAERLSIYPSPPTEVLTDVWSLQRSGPALDDG